MKLLALYCGINSTQLMFLIHLMTYKVTSTPKQKKQYKISYPCRLYLYLDIFDINRKNINYKASIIGTMPYKCIKVYITSEMRLELGEVHFVTNSYLQTKFGLIYDLGFLADQTKVEK